MFDIRTDSEVPIYRQIVDGVRLGVASGRLAPGDEILSVRTMALRLRVNPNTVARAYRELEIAGTIETRRGLGTFIAQGAKKGAMAARRSVVRNRARELVSSGKQAGMSDEEILEAVRAALPERQGART